MENSIEFFLNTHLEWSLSRQDLVIILVNELMAYQGHGHLVIDNHIWELQESFAYINQFTSLSRVKPIVSPKENKKEEKEEVILIWPSLPPPNNKFTTMSSNDESMISAMENPNNQIIEEIDNLIMCLKWFKVLNNIIHFLPSAGYCTISRNEENNSRYWNWIVKGLIKS